MYHLFQMRKQKTLQNLTCLHKIAPNFLLIRSEYMFLWLQNILEEEREEGRNVRKQNGGCNLRPKLSVEIIHYCDLWFFSFQYIGESRN